MKLWSLYLKVEELGEAAWCKVLFEQNSEEVMDDLFSPGWIASLGSSNTLEQ